MTTETFVSVDRVAAPFLPGISLANGRVACARQLHVAAPQMAGVGIAGNAAAGTAVAIEPFNWQRAIAPAAGTPATIAGFAAATKRYAVTTNHAVRGDKGSTPWKFPS